MPNSNIAATLPGKCVDLEHGDPTGTYDCDVPFDAPFSITKYWAEPPTKDATDEKWYVEGRAVIDKMDYQNDVVSPIAMKKALSDLKENSTVLYNHHLDIEIGKVAAYKFLGDSIYIKVLISKTRTDYWKKIQEGVLRKFSMRGRALAFDIRYVPQINTLIRYIKAMTINEISIVSVAAQAGVDFKWYIEKQDRPLSYHIEKAFELSPEGGEAPMKKARKKDASPFKIEKSEDGTQTITIQVPAELEKAAEPGDADLGDIEKAIQAANANIDVIIQAATQVPDGASDVVKTLIGKMAEAAQALKDGGVGAQKDNTAEKDPQEEAKPPGNTLQIVLPASAGVQKADEVAKPVEKDPKEAAKLSAEVLADPNFQKALLGHTEKGLSMNEAVVKASEDLKKADEAAANDQTGIVKSLMDVLVKKDQGMESVNTAVAKLAEIVSGQSATIDTLKKSIDTIPIRKGLQLTEEEIETEKDKISKTLEGQEPRDQLMTILSLALKDQAPQKT